MTRSTPAPRRARRLAWLLALLVLPLPLARADDDDPVLEDAPLSLEDLFQQLGEGNEQVARDQLAARPKEEVQAAARGILAGAAEAAPGRLIGAAVWAGSGLDAAARQEHLRALRERLSAPLEPARVAALLEAVGALGEFDLLQRRLRSGPVEQAGPAARGMCRCPVPAALPALLAAVRELEAPPSQAGPEGDGAPRAEAQRSAAALGALRWFAATRDAERLVRALAEGEQPLSLLEVLLEVRHRPARERTGELARSLVERESAQERALGIRLLVVGRDPGARERLGDLLRDEAPAVRVAAAGAVVDLQARAEIPGVIRLLEDQESEVRVAAHKALVRFARVQLPGRRHDWEAWWQREQARRGE